MKQVKENTKNDFSTKGNSRKSGLEQHYTTPIIADYCTKKFFETVGDYRKTILEPCAGTGEFSKQVEKFSDYLDEMDLDPKVEGMRKGDFLEFEFYGGAPFSVITNPPFGRGNSLSVKFFNHAASAKADFIGFLIPASWRKWSLQNRLDDNYHLVGDFDLPPGQHFYEVGVDRQKPTTLNTVFQVWERRGYKREKVVVEDRGYLVTAIPEEADVRLTTNGWGCGKVSTDFTETVKKNGYRYYKASDEVIDVLREFNENDAYQQFYQHNAYVKSISFQEINYLLNDRL